MKKIKYTENSAIISLNKNIYDKKSIDIALNEYVEFFSSNIIEKGKYLVITIKKIDYSYPIETLYDEFLNYLIGLEFEKK